MKRLKGSTWFSLVEKGSTLFNRTLVRTKSANVKPPLGFKMLLTSLHTTLYSTFIYIACVRWLVWNKLLLLSCFTATGWVQILRYTPTTPLPFFPIDASGFTSSSLRTEAQQSRIAYAIWSTFHAHHVSATAMQHRASTRPPAALLL